MDSKEHKSESENAVGRLALYSVAEVNDSRHGQSTSSAYLSRERNRQSVTTRDSAYNAARLSKHERGLAYAMQCSGRRGVLFSVHLHNTDTPIRAQR